MTNPIPSIGFKTVPMPSAAITFVNTPPKYPVANSPTTLRSQSPEEDTDNHNMKLGTVMASVVKAIKGSAAWFFSLGVLLITFGGIFKVTRPPTVVKGKALAGA